MSTVTASCMMGFQIARITLFTVLSACVSATTSIRWKVCTMYANGVFPVSTESHANAVLSK